MPSQNERPIEWDPRLRQLKHKNITKANESSTFKIAAQLADKANQFSLIFYD